MKKYNTVSLAMAFFFLLMTAFVIWVNYNKPRILVLHSYSNDYIWTREVNTGLDRILEGQSWFSLRYHYMKTKLFKDKDSLRRASIAARHAIEKNRPDVLIAIDDYAQKLAAKYYVDHPDINIVFAGVNGSIEPYGYDKANNVTGILERKQVHALKEVILLISRNSGEKLGRKDRKIRALFLTDPALSGKRDSDYINSFDWEPIDYRGTIFADNYEEWKKCVLEIQERADFLLVSGYRKLPYSEKNSKFVPPETLMEWTEANSPIPIIGMNFFNTNDGAMLSVGVSPYEQGEVAARMALEILSKKKRTRDIPVQTSQQYVISLRKSALKRRDLKVPKIFEAFARATNNYFD